MDFEFLAVKAVGDWELDVLALPYDKRDSDNQFFDANTDTMEAQFGSPAIIYHHGVMPGKGKIENKPVIIGKSLGMTKQADGLHIRVLLDKAIEYAARVWEAAKNGKAVASSDSIAHLARLEVGGKLQMYEKDKAGRIAVWPVAGLSLWDLAEGNFQPASRYAIALPAMKAIYKDAGLPFPLFGENNTDGDLPDADNTAAKRAKIIQPNTKPILENKKMDEKVITPEDVQAQISAALVAHDAALKAAADQSAALEVEVEKRSTEKLDAYKAEAAISRRLDFDGQAPTQTQFSDTYKYDNLTPGELGLAVDFMKSTGKFSTPKAALKALAIKLIEDKRDFGSRDLSPEYSLGAMKAAGLPVNVDAYKATTDPMLTTGTTDGGNWVHTSYGREIWAAIRAEANIVARIPQQVIPDGFKSATIPLEGTDLTWYTVAEAATSDSTLKVPAATVTASQITTPTNKEITVAKMGARGLYSGELTEDSIIGFVPQLRSQLITSGREQLEHAVIDGDSDNSATTNINDIGNGSAVTAGSLFLMLNGFRKLALVTNTANSRAGGSLDEDDYLETMWLLGTAGLGGADLQKCSFIVDPNVYKASLKMASLKTKDVWANATLESGVLTKIWGYDLMPSWFMHYKSAARKANSAGKVDQTTVANNLYGSILGVRWDQWKFAYKRQMTIETTRIANADAYEIVAWARVGLGYRDTEAAGISYGVTV